MLGAQMEPLIVRVRWRPFTFRSRKEIRKPQAIRALSPPAGIARIPAERLRRTRGVCVGADPSKCVRLSEATHA